MNARYRWIWPAAVMVATACERTAPTPSADPTTAPPSAPQLDPPRPDPSQPAAPVAPTSAAPTPTAPTPAPAWTPTAEESKALADYQRIAPFLRTAAEQTLSKADRTWLQGYLGKDSWEWFESNGFAGDSVRKAWLEHRIAEANRGGRAIVRMPLYTNVGWGCEVPSEFVATGQFDAEVLFVLPTGDMRLVERCQACFDLDDTDRYDECVDARCTLQVEGYFTGHASAAKDTCHDIGHEFHIERATVRGGTRSQYFLGLAAGAAAPEGPAFSDGPRWGVMFAKAFRHDPNARARADAQQEVLVEAGHPDAMVLDSRRIATLWCCSWAVLVQRFEDEASARALARTLAKRGHPGALVRPLW